MTDTATDCCPQVEELGAAAALCGCVGRLCGSGALLHHPHHSCPGPHQRTTPTLHLAPLDCHVAMLLQRRHACE